MKIKIFIIIFIAFFSAFFLMKNTIVKADSIASSSMTSMLTAGLQPLNDTQGHKYIVGFKATQSLTATELGIRLKSGADPSYPLTIQFFGPWVSSSSLHSALEGATTSNSIAGKLLDSVAITINSNTPSSTWTRASTTFDTQANSWYAFQVNTTGTPANFALAADTTTGGNAEGTFYRTWTNTDEGTGGTGLRGADPQYYRINHALWTGGSRTSGASSDYWGLHWYLDGEETVPPIDYGIQWLYGNATNTVSDFNRWSVQYTVSTTSTDQFYIQARYCSRTTSGCTNGTYYYDPVTPVEVVDGVTSSTILITKNTALAGEWTVLFRLATSSTNIASTTVASHSVDFRIAHGASSDWEEGIPGIQIASSSNYCVEPTGITDVGGGIAYGYCVLTKFLFVPHAISETFLDRKVDNLITTFPFNIVYNLASTTIDKTRTATTTSGYDLYFDTKSTNPIPILTSTTLESVAGSSTKQTFFTVISNLSWLVTGLAIIGLIIL